MTVSLSAVQENLICLLSYSDKHALTVRNLFPVELWGGPNAIIAPRIYDFIDRYKKPPKDHIADLMADKLENKKNPREKSLYEDILLSIKELWASGLNEEYAISQLELTIRRQSMRAMAVDLAKLLQKDTDESLDEAEKLLTTAKAQTASVFNPGLRLSDKDRVLDFLEQQDACFPTGIPDLDKRGFGPTRKELWLYIAAAKRGKTWMLIQLAKMAMLHRLKVCHVSLEMSEPRMAQRYFQALFAMSKRKEKFTVNTFAKDQLGRFTGFDEKEVTPSITMDDPNIRKKLERRISRFGPRMLDNVFVKQFPGGSLTVRGLIGYLDNLESNERFIPDLLIVDYPDLMKIDKNNPRFSIDEIYKELRGLAVERNMALAIVSQGNRSSETAKTVRNDHVAEAWSKIAHADCVITYNQSKSEHKMKLARLIISAGRNDEDKLSIVVSQNYAMGTFVNDSVLMTGDYWRNLPEGDEEG